MDARCPTMNPSARLRFPTAVAVLLTLCAGRSAEGTHVGVITPTAYLGGQIRHSEIRAAGGGAEQEAQQGEDNERDAREEGASQ